jgi:hypothetical protein
VSFAALPRPRRTGGTGRLSSRSANASKGSDFEVDELHPGAVEPFSPPPSRPGEAAIHPPRHQGAQAFEPTTSEPRKSPAMRSLPLDTEVDTPPLVREVKAFLEARSAAIPLSPSPLSALSPLSPQPIPQFDGGCRVDPEPMHERQGPSYSEVTSSTNRPVERRIVQEDDGGTVETEIVPPAYRPEWAKGPSGP